MESVINKTLGIKDALMSVLGIPTMTVFVHEDPLKIFENISPVYSSIFWVMIILAIFLSLFQFVTLFYNPSIIKCKGEIQINEKMLSITKEAGNTCILSRNMSWANGRNVMEALKNKARNGDLTLFVNEDNKTTKTLKEHGANVIVYKGAIPRCRFTIKGYKGGHARLYIAKVNSPDRHVIHHHTKADDVTLKLAEDLVHVLEAKK